MANDTVITIAEMPEKQAAMNEKSIFEAQVEATASSTEMGDASFSPAPKRPTAVSRQPTLQSKHDEDYTLTKYGEMWFKLMRNPILRYATYIIPVATLLAVPLVLFDTVYKDRRADHIRLLGLFIWIEMVWVLLWVAKLIAQAIPYLFSAICGTFDTGIRKYSLVLRALEIPISLFLWACLAIGAFPAIYTFDKAYHAQHAGQIPWLSILHKVCKASIGVAALNLAEKFIIQMISVEYHKKQYYDKIKENKKLTRCIDLMYHHSVKKFPDHHPDFIEEDLDIHDTSSLRRDTQGRLRPADTTTLRVISDIGWYGDKVTAAFGNMASDIAGRQVLKPTASRMVVETALERQVGAQALARRIFNSFITPGSKALYLEDIISNLGHGREADAAYLFDALDRDGNGDISMEEMVALVEAVARERRVMWKGACDVKEAIKILDRVLSFFVLIIIFLIYAAFFSTYLATRYAQIWSTFTGLSFLFSATAGELFGACILVFIKHPYDIGDRVDMNGIELEVTKISLLYTIFRRIDTGRSVQIPNSSINGYWIENISRSKAMKELFKFSVSASTTFTDLELLRAELQAFVQENKRDYLPDVDIQLVSPGDLKQLDLSIEIQHKSNWQNESLRAARRSKFMCALLSAMRKIPIAGPGGSTEATPLSERYTPDPSSPVAEMMFGKAISSGLEILPSLMNTKGGDGVKVLGEGHDGIRGLRSGRIATSGTVRSAGAGSNTWRTIGNSSGRQGTNGW